LSRTYTADPPPAPRLDVTAVASDPPRTPPIRTATTVTSDYPASLLLWSGMKGDTPNRALYRRGFATPPDKPTARKAKRKYKGSKAAKKASRK